MSSSAKDVIVQQPAIFSDVGARERGPGISARLKKLGVLARQNPLGTIGLVVILVFGLAAVFAPLIAPYDPNGFTGVRQENISSAHIFGTERLGRDIFSRVVYGGRISLSVAFISVISICNPAVPPFSIRRSHTITQRPSASRCSIGAAGWS